MRNKIKIFVVCTNNKPIYFTELKQDAVDILKNEMKYSTMPGPNYLEDFVTGFHRYKSEFRNASIILEDRSFSSKTTPTQLNLLSIYYIRNLKKKQLPFE